MNLQDKINTFPIFEKIAEAACQEGVPAYVIGGFVRDLLLKRPSKDIDIVCVGSGIALAERLSLIHI